MCGRQYSQNLVFSHLKKKAKPRNGRQSRARIRPSHNARAHLRLRRSRSHTCSPLASGPATTHQPSQVLPCTTRAVCRAHSSRRRRIKLSVLLLRRVDCRPDDARRRGRAGSAAADAVLEHARRARDAEHAGRERVLDEFYSSRAIAALDDLLQPLEQKFAFCQLFLSCFACLCVHAAGGRVSVGE